MKGKKKIVGLAIYFILLIIPIYWMLNMSLRSNADILASFSLYPKNITFMNYMKIFTDSSWYMGYVNSIFLRGAQYGHLAFCGTAGGLCLLPLSVCGGQTDVFLVADQPHGAGSCFCASLFPALFDSRADGHAYRRSPGPLPVQRPSGGLDSGGLHERCAQRD